MPKSPEGECSDDGLSRRSFLKGVGIAAAGGAMLPAAAGASAQPDAGSGPRVLSGSVPAQLRINGRIHELELEPRTTLLSALRHRCDPPLTGTKIACDQGTCGACTVLLDGQPVYACMVLALDAVGREVTTVEGLAKGEELSAVQQSFWEHDASMCGFCTPGFVVSVSAAIEARPDATREQIQSACAGNLCRCGTQPHVFDAALDAARKLRGEKR